MNEIDQLLNDLKNLKSTAKNDPSNTRDFWRKINSNAGFKELGFESEEDLKSWISENPYANII